MRQIRADGGNTATERSAIFNQINQRDDQARHMDWTPQKIHVESSHDSKTVGLRLSAFSRHFFPARNA